MAMDALSAGSSLLSSLDCIVRGFRSLRLSLSFHKDLDYCYTRLSISSWMLTNWAKYYKGPDIPEEIQRLLCAIEKAFEEAKKYSALASDAELDQAPTTLSVDNIDDLRNNTKALNDAIQQRVKAGPKAARITNRMLWVLYRREDLQRILDTASEAIHCLYERCPGGINTLSSDFRKLTSDLKEQDRTLDVTLLERASKELQETRLTFCDTFNVRLDKSVNGHIRRRIARGAPVTGPRHVFNIGNFEGINTLLGSHHL
ncbi:MAG: hypothetical protein Q9162_004282 [Coniocarpon cinnabarinum]